ncbi:MAG: PHB depolymerase family esterase [Pseudomonadota bacterium]
MLFPWPAALNQSFLMNGTALGSAENRPAAPQGRFIERSYWHDNGAMRYKLYIPGGYHGQSLPLLVMLHGCTQNADDFAAGTRMNQLAEERQCFVAYPEQSSAANGARCWNWYEQANQQRDRGEPAVIAGITREIIAEYGIDADSVFVAGLSAGGAMAIIMSQVYPELFTAVGSHSGMPYGAANDLSSAMEAMREGAARKPGAAMPLKRMPIIVFQGDTDTTVHPNNSVSIIDQCVPGRHGKLERTRKALAHDGADARSFTHTTHRDALGKTVAEQWTVHGAGHAWSGGHSDGSYIDANGPDAGREMLRFFMGIRRPKSRAAPRVAKAAAKFAHAGLRQLNLA